MTTEIAEYSATDAALATLAQSYKGVVYPVTTPKGMTEAKAARADLRTYRTSLEAMRVSLKEGILERGRKIDGEAKRIRLELEALEDPIVEQIKVEEKRLEDIRLAKVREEEARLKAIEDEKLRVEKDRLAAERAELARQQAELAKAQEAQREREAASKREIEERERAARLKIEEEGREARRLAAEEEERQRKIRWDAEEVARKEREEELANMREAQRKVDELADADERLRSFVERFGHIEKYAGVVQAIKAVQP